MNTNKTDPFKPEKLAPEDEAADLLNEGGSIGDEQCPAYVQKTDKREWGGASDKAKGEGLLPRKMREFLNGL